MAGIAFGLFDWIDDREVPLEQLYEERLEVLTAADAAGFSCYHRAEHHATPLGMAPLPGLFLAAAAQRTRQIRLGPLVYVLPLYEPLRLIEEMCLGAFGRDPARSRAMFEEALAVIVAGMAGGRLRHKGEYYQYDDVPLELSPRQRPYPPFWYATSNVDSVAWAAARGMHLVGLGPAQTFRPFVERYREAWKRHASDPGRLNPHVTTPRLGMTRQVIVAEGDTEAEAIARAVHPRWAASFLKLWNDHGDTTYQHRVNLDAALRGETILCGSPARVREQLGRLIEQTEVNYVVCCFAWGDLTLAQSLRSLRLFATEVMPGFAGSAS